MPSTRVTPARGNWVTRANVLTATRLGAAPVLALCIVTGATRTAMLAFGFAVATDLLDGRVARRYGEASSLGGFLDHATDATLVSVALGALAWAGSIPGLLPCLVALAFLQYAVDSGVLALSGRDDTRAAEPTLRASFLGRWNGVAYYVLVGIPVVRDGLGLAWPSRALVHGLGSVLVLSTLVSMIDRACSTLRTRPSGPSAKDE